MEHVTGKHVNYYHICHRKLWLFEHGISMQHGSEAVADGSLLHETAYPGRAERWREIQIAGIKIDFYDPERKIVYEIKRSRALEEAQVAQLKFYLYVLEQHGVEGPAGVLSFPKQRRTREVELTDEDRGAIPGWEADIRRIVADERCPALLCKPVCTGCSYYEFCYSGEGPGLFY